MLFKNESNQEVYIAIGRGLRVGPGDTIEIEDGYAAPRRADNGSRRPSIIEGLAPQLKPADAAERAVWEQVPASNRRGATAASPNAGLPTVEGLMAAGVPRGVAEGIVRSALEAALGVLKGEPVTAAAETAKKGK